MKDLHKIGKNKTFKIIGLAVVFYFIFLSKKNPDSITNHVTMEEIKQGAHDLKEKTSFIKDNLQAAREATKNNASNDLKKDAATSDETMPTKAEENYADEKYKIICGDEIEISYKILVGNKENAGAPQYQKFVIGSNTNYFIEHAVVGMSKNDSKKVPIPQDIKIGKNGKPALGKPSDVAYHVTITSVKKAVQPTLTCY
jgi:hypothetical protein